MKGVLILDALTSAWTALSGGFTFLSDNPLLIAFIAVPLALGIVGALVRVFGR